MECTVIKYILLNQTVTEQYRSLESKYHSLFSSLKAILKSDFNLTTAYMLFDDMLCEYYESSELQYNFTDEITTQLKMLSMDYWVNYVYFDEKIRKIALTYMFREWCNLINEVVINDRLDLKRDVTLNFALYIGSTYNIIPVLMAIGVDMRLFEYVGYSAYLLIIM